MWKSFGKQRLILHRGPGSRSVPASADVTLHPSETTRKIKSFRCLCQEQKS